MLLQRSLEVPHLPLDRLGKLEDPPGEQGPVPPQRDLEQRPVQCQGIISYSLGDSLVDIDFKVNRILPGNSSRVLDDVVQVGDEGKGVHPPPRYVRLNEDVDLGR